MLTACRIVKSRHARGAFTGEGARIAGGRWNSPGVAMVYLAQSLSLSALEMLAHLDSDQLLRRYVVFDVRFDVEWVVTLDPALLPRNWRAHPAPAKVQAIGDAWIASRESAVLAVPSVIVPSETNYLLNPAHPDFARLEIVDAKPFQFDRRLM